MLLIAKFNACGLRLKTLKLMNNFQENQRTKTNESYSSWSKQILFGVPQGLVVLRPILFDIFLSNVSAHCSISLVFLILNNTDFDSYASYANDNTLDNACGNVDSVAET